MAEHMNSETKLRDRIEYLESKLAKYDHTVREEDVEAELAKHSIDTVEEEHVERERQQLLRHPASDSESD